VRGQLGGLDKPALLVVKAVDAQGQELAVVFAGPLSAGKHTVLWNGRGKDGRVMVEGARLEAKAWAVQ
jgi:methionine-rich copper-binding protein CopC